MAVQQTPGAFDPNNLVSGPATSTDNALLRFNGEDGSTVKDSSVTVDDSGELGLPVAPNILSGGSTTIDTGPGAVKMSSSNAASNDAWIPIKYNGTTYYVPGWLSNSP